MAIERYLRPQIERDLSKKMVFVGGPRQVGKTTLAKRLLAGSKGYMNWDVPEDRDRILKGKIPASPLWVFDEIHKYRGWRNYLKGTFDHYGPRQKILVTGSGRLDYYRFGGDSLQGRYHYLRLHPLSVAELGINSQKDFAALLRLGGFPEPFFGGSEENARRWTIHHRTRILQDDVSSLEDVSDLGKLELMVLRLPELVGSPLSLNALREDIQVSHRTASHWMQSLERLYAVFRVAPFGPPRVRAVKKEQKHYHFDWSQVPKKPARFENLVACHLLKWVHLQQDAKGLNVELRYFRDALGHEVDFIILEDGQPTRLIECKWGDDEVSPSLRLLKHRYREAQAWQISAVGTNDYISGNTGVRVSNALTFLKELI